MKDNNIVPLKSPTPDTLGELLKRGAQELLAKAIESELAELLSSYNDELIDGKKVVVRNGYQPERSVQTGLGDISVKIPKVRDRSKQGVKFNSKLIPPYLRRTKNLEEFIPWLYLKGISTGDMQPA
ncbi:MAG: IS256 family transposase, partial [Methylococcales bacterium]|nr:IS256 family transposase [Methylococcales bacterium]